MPTPKLVFLIAGEASGDQLGAALMATMKTQQNVQFIGIGGDAMKAQGLESLFPMEELSLMGYTSILRDLPNLYGRLKLTVRTIRELKPDVVVTIDSPEFSLRVAKQLHKLADRPRLIHYVAPTVWAWKASKAHKIASFLDHLLCLYPFEPPLFEKFGLKTTFVGHPVGLDPRFREDDATERDPNLLCVLPGSRRSEIHALLPIFAETVILLQQNLPDLKVVLPTLPSLKKYVSQAVLNWPVPCKVVEGLDQRDDAFRHSHAALAASGTVALQLSAARLPFLIAYKLGKLNGILAKLLIKTPWACMVNILLAFHRYGNLDKKNVPEPWIPEFIQENCQPALLAPALLKLMKDSKARNQEIQAMDEAIRLLDAPAKKAATVVLEEIYPNPL